MVLNGITEHFSFDSTILVPSHVHESLHKGIPSEVVAVNK